jgi:hypothetical protein
MTDASIQARGWPAAWRHDAAQTAQGPQTAPIVERAVCSAALYEKPAEFARRWHLPAVESRFLV